MANERIVLRRDLHSRGQAIEALAHVDHAGDQQYPCRWWQTVDASTQRRPRGSSSGRPNRADERERRTTRSRSNQHFAQPSQTAPPPPGAPKRLTAPRSSPGSTPSALPGQRSPPGIAAPPERLVRVDAMPQRDLGDRSARRQALLYHRSPLLSAERPARPVTPAQRWRFLSGFAFGVHLPGDGRKMDVRLRAIVAGGQPAEQAAMSGRLRKIAVRSVLSSVMPRPDRRRRFAIVHERETLDR